MTKYLSVFEKGARVGAAALALVFCAGAPSSADNPGRVEGTVVAADTGAPIKGAKVSLEGSLLPDGTRIPPTRTDERGRFVFGRVSAERWLVCVWAPEDSPYVTAIIWSYEHRGDAIEIEVKPTSVTRVTVRLRRGGEILARTVRRDGTPWPGFQATRSCPPSLVRLTPPEGMVGYRSEMIGGGSECLLRGIPPDTPLKLEANPTGYVNVAVSPAVVAVGERKRVDLVIDLDDPTGIEGTAPPNRILMVVREADWQRVAGDTVGPDGRFSIVGLAPGRYVVWCELQEYPVEVRGGAKTRLEIPVPAGPSIPRKTGSVAPDVQAPTQKRREPTVAFAPGLEPSPENQAKAFATFNRAYHVAVDTLLSCLPESCLRLLRPRLFEGPPYTFTIKSNTPDCGQYFSNNIWIGQGAFSHPPRCGCLESVIFHEITHDAPYPDECSAYRCAKKCFPCAEQDLKDIVVKSLMGGLIHVKCPDDTPCCPECK